MLQRAINNLDVIEKQQSPTEKPKDEKEKKKKDKKEKEKRPGMLSGLFKRSKDKKYKYVEADVDEDSQTEKTSVDSSRSSPVQKISEESTSPSDVQNPQFAAQAPTAGQPTRQTSKLQKQSPGNLAINKSRSVGRISPIPEAQTQSELVAPQQTQAPAPAPDRPAPTPSDATSTTPAQLPEIMQDGERDRPPLNVQIPDSSLGDSTTNTELKKESSPSMFAPLTNILKHSTSSSGSEPKPEKVKKAKQRVELDDFDSSPEDDEPLDSLAGREPSTSARISADHQASHLGDKDRLSESPIEVSPIYHNGTNAQQPPGLVPDSSSQEESSDMPRSISPISPSSSPSPDMINHSDLASAPPSLVSKTLQTRETPTTASSTTPTPTWSDASLRTYFEDDNDIRDLLIVVSDKSGVVPAGPEHPLMKGLYGEQKTQLHEMGTRLDGLLEGLLARNKVGQKL